MKNIWNVVVLLFSVQIFLFSPFWNAPVSAQTAADWYMTGANPQRTSWVTGSTNEIRGNLTPVWYRAIDPYVDSKTQVIASEGKLFISTSQGLYAFDANTGSQLWVYGTELPLGNSPTYFNGTLYVGGFDHKIHAVTAATGQLKSGWTFVNADAGFDTNPLVINDSYTNNQPLVIAGNRDGYLYALDGDTGALKWKFQTAGPIHFSAAYKNGRVYFASNDAHVYSVNIANGNLLWKSEQFPGVGFDMYWPVIYTDTYSASPTNGQDFLIVAGSLKAGRWVNCPENKFGCQIHTPNFEMYDGKPGCTQVNSEPYLWTPNTPTLKCDSIYNYYNSNSAKWGNQKPWWRVVYILDPNTGIEQTPYAPFNTSGMDGDGQGYKQPPIIGQDGVIYQRIGYGASGNGGCDGWIAGWKFNTPYISHISTENAACDEPAAFTGGGNLLYYGEGSFNHEGFGTIDIANPQSGDWKWTNSVSNSIKYNNLSIFGQFGGNSGAYFYMDGLQNHSPIPYQGKLYIINGNVLYALSPNGNATSPLPMVQAPASTIPANITTNPNRLQQILSDQVQKMLTAGHLRPGFHSSGLTSQWLVGAYNGPIPGANLEQYFINPSDTIITLGKVLDYIKNHPENSTLQSLQNPIKTYLQTNYGPGSPYSVTQYASIGWNNGAQRELYPDLPEMIAHRADTNDFNYNMANNPRSFIWTYNNLRIATSDPNSINGGFPPDSFYGAWKYAQIFPSSAATIFNQMQSKLSIAGQSNDMNDANLIKYPYILNQYIIGYRGYVELDKMANNLTDISQSSKYAEYNRLVSLRINNYSKDPTNLSSSEGFVNVLNAARNFMYLTPELATVLKTNVKTLVQQTIDQYHLLTPYWFVSKYNRSGPESFSQPLYDYPAQFQARAYILNQPYSELIKYIDVPAFEKGDLFYIQNLVAALTIADSQSASFQVTYLSTDTNGVKSYTMTSEANGNGTHVLRVLEPTNPAAGIPHRFLYVLPVEAELNTQFGDGLETLRSLNAHNQYNATIIAPSFKINSWYADHPSDPNYRYETFMTQELHPWVTLNLAVSGNEQHWLLGFSKSGYGGLDLIFKHPDLFAVGAFWDFPANMTSHTDFAADANYGTQENFDNNYRLTGTFLDTYKAPFLSQNRLWLGGYGFFQADMTSFETLITSKNIQHTTAPSVSLTHRWDSGWVPSALVGLATNAATYNTTPTPTNSTKPGDANADSQVNILDYQILANTFGSTTDLRADFNGSGNVNILDYQILANNFGSTASSTPPPSSSTSTPTPAPNLFQGLVGYWKFDDNVSGNTKSIIDSSGNGVTGTTNTGANATGMDCTVSGHSGKACLFDGKDDSISLSSTAGLNPKDQLSISAWINIPECVTFSTIISHTLWEHGYWFNHSSNCQVGANLENIVNFQTFRTNPISTNTWHHVAVTYTNDGSADNANLYIDGTLAQTLTLTGSISYSSPDLKIGITSGQNFPFNGTLDELRIYDRALSSTEIQQLANI